MLLELICFIPQITTEENVENCRGLFKVTRLGGGSECTCSFMDFCIFAVKIASDHGEKNS